MGTILLTLFTVPLLYAWVEEFRLSQRQKEALDDMPPEAVREDP